MIERPRKSELLTPERHDRDKVGELIRNLHQEAQQPMGRDPRTAAWCRATIPELYRDGKLHPLMENIFAFRRVRESHFPVVYAQRLAMRAVQKQALKRLPRTSYPAYADAETFWKHEVYDNIFDPEEFDIDMSWKNNQANLPNRGKAFDLVTRFFAERLGPNPTVLDIGASNNLVLKKMKAKRDFPYSYTKVVIPAHGERYVGEDYQEVPESSEKINHLLDLDPLLGSGLGIDIFPINHDDVEANVWVMSCSFYPSELLEHPDRVEEFDELSTKDVEGIHYAKQNNIDVRDKDSLSKITKFLEPLGSKVDLAVFSYVLYEMTDDEITKAFENLRPYCHDGTLFAINEPARANPKAPNGLEFVHQKKWVIPYNSRTIIIEPLRPEVPAYELFKWRTGRYNEVWLTPQGQKHLDAIKI